MTHFTHPSIFRKSLCLILAGSLLIFSVPVKVVAQEKMNVAVLDLEGRGISALEAATLTDRLRSEMVELGYFQVVERGQMEMILEEQGFQQVGCTSVECAVEVGKLLGVEKMVAGTIGKIGALYTVDVRMFDVTTGAIEKVSKRDHRGDVEGLIDLLGVVSKDLAGIEVEVAEVRKEEPAEVVEAEAEPEPEKPKKKGRFGRILLGTVVLAAVGGGAYYYLTVLQGEAELPGPPPAPPPTPGR